VFYHFTEALFILCYYYSNDTAVMGQYHRAALFLRHSIYASIHHLWQMVLSCLLSQ